MTNAQSAMRPRTILNPRGVQHLSWDRRALGKAVLRMQAHYIRSTIQTEIKDFADSFEAILQTTNIFLVMTEKISQSPSLVLVDPEAITENVCRFLASSNSVLEFLAFQQHSTGLASGGDPSLEHQVKKAQELVMELLNTLILHNRAETYPGKENGCIYDEDIKAFGGRILHKNSDAEPDEAPDPHLQDDLSKLGEYWHTEEPFNPLTHMPGTHWHKFFGNLVLVWGRPMLFRKRERGDYIKVYLPDTITWLQPEIMNDYNKYRDMFETYRRLPRPRLYQFIRDTKVRRVQRRLSHFFKGWKESEDLCLLSPEDLSDIHSAEFDVLGVTRLEALNAEINAPELAGTSLSGDEILPMPEFIEGELRYYWFQTEDRWW
ncbi:hypothetical protein B0J18DRAFT_90752 [Chaetomium sp. MPI-SDFR-AT-0129]|nr:hypothetical protein B0J18DRAFT_90752 [Chaetomium sp. MPI-SDFR-AT-0129]